jgi:ribonuclease HI
MDFKNTTVIFCDGACSGNPGPGGWGAIIATPNGTITELGAGDPSTTNNRMELLATISALLHVRAVAGPVMMCTDSTYVIRGVTQWVFGWRKRGWTTAEGKPVLNQDLWEELSRLAGERNRVHENKIEWHYVRGHTGVPGNERCDEIAVSFSKGEHVKLFRGPLIKYSIAIYDIPENTDLPEPKEPGEPKAKAFSYLSLLNGVPMRHSTWPECERRVKGQSGAKFKKAMSPEDETAVLKSWGVDPKKLNS